MGEVTRSAWGEGHLYAHGPVLLTDNIGEGADQVCIAYGAQAQGLRPLGKAESHVAGADDRQEVMARVGADHQGNAQPTLCGNGLQGVVLGGEGAGGPTPAG